MFYSIIMSSLSIIIPVYNEIEQISLTINKLTRLKKKINFEVIFIDDFSTDNSFKEIKKISKKKKYIKIFKNKTKGLGSAINYGIKKSKSNYICIFMCDLSDDTTDLIKYYKIISMNKNIDAVFGTRFSKFSKIKNYPLLKLTLNRIANNLIKIITFSDYNDFTNAFKIYKRETLYNLMPIVSENFNVFLELPLKIISRKYNYKIIPINWNGRKKGVSKFKIKEIGSMYIFTLLYCLLEKILLKKRKI
jgi:dolichol-phosphate mannosyltransferase